MKILKAGTDKNASALELKNRALARRAAEEGFVLPENDGTLPLNACCETKRLLKTGVL